MEPHSLGCCQEFAIPDFTLCPPANTIFRLNGKNCNVKSVLGEVFPCADDNFMIESPVVYSENVEFCDDSSGTRICPQPEEANGYGSCLRFHNYNMTTFGGPSYVKSIEFTISFSNTSFVCPAQRATTPLVGFES